MATFELTRRYWQRTRERNNRLRDFGAISSFRAPLRTNKFIDYYAYVPGTLPEKIIFNILAHAGISFYFAPFMGDVPFTKDVVEHFRPDFVLPDYRIIIEIQGQYWHSREGSFDRDYQRAMWFTAMGFKVLTVYDQDVLNNPWKALSDLGILYEKDNPGGGAIFIEGRPQDPTAALRAIQQKWPRKNVIHQKRTGSRIQDALSRFTVRTRAPQKAVENYPVFTSKDVDPGIEQTYREYGTEFNEYIISLGEYFTKYPTAATYYPTQYRYWTRWKSWFGMYN